MNKWLLQLKLKTSAVLGILPALTLQDKILFAKRLSLLTRAGVPIVKALNMIRDQAPRARARAVFTAIIETVERGGYISSGMRDFRVVFGDFAIHVVEVGELSGTLQENLLYLSQELQKKQQLRRKVWAAMLYPCFIVVATVGMVALLMAYVFPRLLPIFSSLQFELPLSTQILIWVSHFIRVQLFWILPGLVALVLALVFVYRDKRTQRIVHRVLLYLPLVGKLLQGYYAASCTRTLGLLLASDVPIVKATSITGTTMTSVLYHDALLRVSEQLTKGETLAQNLNHMPLLFPPVMAQMVAVGETTGNLNGTLLFLSEMYESEVDDLTKNLATILEPVLMVFIGLAVGFVALAIITPIYGITQNIRAR